MLACVIHVVLGRLSCSLALCVETMWCLIGFMRLGSAVTLPRLVLPNRIALGQLGLAGLCLMSHTVLLPLVYGTLLTFAEFSAKSLASTLEAALLLLVLLVER